ncbi:hypothetical protein ACIQI7_15530 [Kitasatospora sp. NPDC092039]|uniref:hypothetical protein n=1 Tax=Kitasatospora sp. NPDC092039 TaxID=3364086 RepID=UPI0038159353
MSPTTLNLPSVFSEDDFDLDVREVLAAEHVADGGPAMAATGTTMCCTVPSNVICQTDLLCQS